MANPTRETFEQLARSLYYGGLDMDGLQFTVKPHLPQDIEFQKYRVVRAFSESYADGLRAIEERFDKIERPGVIVWERS